jgi:hypothetical protein
MCGTDLEVPPGGFFVLVEDEEVFAAIHPEIERAIFRRPEGGWPTLNDVDGPLGFADAVILRDCRGTMIDSVAYRRRWSTAGVSVERIDPGATSWASANWSPHHGPGPGSPGRGNSVSFHLPEHAGLLSMSPQTFSPDGDGEDDLVAFSVTLPQPGLVRLTVFDANGRVVNRLVDGEVIEAERITFWDGRRSDDTEAPMGVYFALLEARLTSADRMLKSRAPVVLVRR